MLDTLLRIRLFVAVYEERSFTAAAARENATQSGVTQHIRKLEDHFGVTLFLREAGGICPTPAADAYYRRCLQVLQAHNQSRALLESFKTDVAGHISIGLTPTITSATLAPALARFVSRRPNVVVQITDAYSDIVIEKVRSGEIDCCVVPGAAEVAGMRSEFFARSPEFLVAGRASGLRIRHAEPVRLGKVGPIKIVVPTMAQKRRVTLEAYLVSVGAIVDKRLEIDTALGALDFIAQSDWVGIHPGITMLRELSKRDLIVAPLIDPPLAVDLFRMERAREPLSAVVRSFLEVLQCQAVSMAHQAEGFARCRAVLDGAGERGPRPAKTQ